MSVSVDLVVLSGPLEGTRILLDSREVLRLGRSRQGVDLEDPLVSIDHAAIAFDRDRYWITDLASASGTFVNGQRIGSDPVKLRIGDIVRIGESEMRVVERPLQNLLRMVLVVCIMLASLPIVYQFIQNRPLSYIPVVTLRGEVLGAGGPYHNMAVPLGFVRREGVDHRGLVHTRTTDIDDDGIQEVWLSTAEQDYIVSMNERGSWRYHGTVPRNCEELPGTNLAPEFDCSGIRRKWLGGTYRDFRLDGLTVWTAGPGGVEVAQLDSLDSRVFGAWLSERGVTEPVHYLICEGWLPGIPAQVLTESGVVRGLSKGCLTDVNVVAAGLELRAPYAAAFTASGMRALRDDMSVQLTGSVDGRLASTDAEPVLQSLNQQSRPIRRGRLDFLTSFAPGTQGGVAREGQEQGLHELVYYGEDKPAPVVKAQLLSEGAARLEGGGCVVLEVNTLDWGCSLAKGCRSASQFMTVDEVGCGERTRVLAIPYAGGTITRGTPHVDVLVDVVAESDRLRTDVLQVEIYIRPK